MRNTYSKVLFATAILLLLSFQSLIAQTVTVTGDATVEPGSQHYYEATFDYSLSNPQSLTWNATGGTIISQQTLLSTVWCIVEWDNSPKSGNVSLHDNNQNVTGDKAVNVQLVCRTADAGSDQTNCGSSGVTIGTSSSGGYTYSWAPTTGLSNASVAQPTANPGVSTTYTLSMNPNDNLITNNNFESSLTGYSSDYTRGTGQGSYSITTNANSANSNWCNMSDHSAVGANMMVVDGYYPTNAPNYRILYKTVSVTSGSNYIFSGYLSNLTTGAFSGNANVVINVIGNISGTSSTTITLYPNTCGNWTNFSVNWSSGSNTQATIEIRFNNTINIGNDLGIDDLYFGNCLPSEDQVTVYVSPSTPIVTPAGPITYYNHYEANNSVVLTSSTASSYQWYKNSSAISGATSQTYTINISGLGSYTDYYYCATTCGTSNTVTFNYYGCMTNSGYPMSVPTGACMSQLSGTNFPLPKQSLGTGTTYSWSFLTNPTCLSINPSGYLTQSGCGSNTSNGIYTLSSKGTERLYMFYYFFATYGCRMANPDGDSEPKDSIVHIVKVDPKVRLPFVKELAVYPNPAHDQIKVISPNTLSRITIYDAKGQVVYQTGANGYDKTIDISRFRAGLYIIKVIDDKGTKQLQLIVQ
jgi:hypothetical protein